MKEAHTIRTYGDAPVGLLHGSDLPISLTPCFYRLRRFAILLRARAHPSLIRGPLHRRLPPFRHVYEKPRHETRKSAEDEQDREGLPVVSFLVDYHLNHIRSNNCRGAICQSE